MNIKQIALIVLLIVVIFVAALIAVKRTHSGMEPVAMAFTDLKETKIDMKSLELFTETISEWEGKYAPDASGCYKNPKTGTYTVVKTMKCAYCGEVIPEPQLPPELVIKTPPGKRGSMPSRAILKKIADFQLKYICPKCGHPALIPKGAETKTPETKALETKPPETKAPETKPPETKPPETEAPETKPPETKPAESTSPEPT